MQTADSYLDSIAAENEAKCGRCGRNYEEHDTDRCICGHQHIWDIQLYRAIDTQLCVTEPDDRCELPHPYRYDGWAWCPDDDGTFER